MPHSPLEDETYWHLLRLQQISDFLETPIYVHNVSIADYFKLNSLVLSYYLLRDRSSDPDKKLAHKVTISRIGAILNCLGWQCKVPVSKKWTILRIIASEPDIIARTQIMELNDMCGYNFCSPRARGFMLSRKPKTATSNQNTDLIDSKISRKKVAIMKREEANTAREAKKVRHHPS